ncbi:TetR/AcrR family transcriptional regulator, partial [Clavibacter michiganensis]
GELIAATPELRECTPHAAAAPAAAARTEAAS